MICKLEASKISIKFMNDFIICCLQLLDYISTLLSYCNPKQWSANKLREKQIISNRHANIYL